MILLSALHDPTGLFENKIKALDTNFYDLFTGIYILHTDTTAPESLSRFAPQVHKLVGGKYSESKVLGIKEALVAFPDETYFYCDFDKVLLWHERYKDEFNTRVNSPLTSNYLILGRSDKAFETYPQSWVKTESITNRCLSKELGKAVEALTATCIFDAQAGALLAQKATGTEWESPVEWPLLVYQANKSIGFETAEGLIWEDPYLYYTNTEESLSTWQERIYDSPKEWAKRIDASLQQVTKIAELKERLGKR